MLLTVLIPNFNGKKLLQNFLPSIYDSLHVANVSFEFIIVDDCSNDDSKAYIKDNYPDIELIENNSNLGFSKTCNKGIKKAKGKYLLLLNTDIKLTPDYIKICLQHFKDSNTFAVMGQAIDESSEPQTTGILFKQMNFSVKKYPNNENNETHFVSGANAIYDTEKLKALKGFNTIFSPYYFEDDDLSYRAMEMGWKSYFIKEAKCYHLGSSTIKSCAQKRKIKRVYFRNKMIFNNLHCKSSKALFDTNHLIMNIIPKYCIGNFWIWKSYNEYRKLTLKV